MKNMKFATCSKIAKFCQKLTLLPETDGIKRRISDLIHIDIKSF